MDEKEALGLYLDGDVSVVIGTHTHVQTGDERILPGGTAYITDIGMTGPVDSVIGMKKETAISRSLTQMPLKMEVAVSAAEIQGVFWRSTPPRARPSGSKGSASSPRSEWGLAVSPSSTSSRPSSDAGREGALRRNPQGKRARRRGKVLKPGVRVRSDAEILLHDRPPFVSRGGEKLAAALDPWKSIVRAQSGSMPGCSTGGFTDCLLQRGAGMVYAVDVGERQLDWGLREDGRVVVKEGTNVMGIDAADLTPPRIGPWPTSRSVPAWSGPAHPRSDPRGLGHFPRQTAVRVSRAARRNSAGWSGAATEVRSILEDLLRDLAAEGVIAEAALPSPIKGRKGNREFLFRLTRAGDERAIDPLAILEDIFWNEARLRGWSMRIPSGPR